MNTPLAITFITVALMLWIVQLIGFYKKNRLQRWLPAFLAANGIGFFIPAHIWFDGLILGLCAVTIVEVTSWTKPKKQQK